jgi:hypothetical protein
MTAAVIAGVNGRSRGRRPDVSSAQRKEAYDEQERFWKDLVGVLHLGGRVPSSLLMQVIY